MSEKRFALEYDKNCYKCIADIQKQELYTSKEEICDLLNQLNDENEQLRQTVHNLKQEPTQKDWDLLVQKCAELSKRNIKLWERLGEKEQEERLYADEIVRLNKEVKDNQFLRLGNDY